jgi:hypothetical protein
MMDVSVDNRHFTAQFGMVSHEHLKRFPAVCRTVEHHAQLFTFVGGVFPNEAAVLPAQCVNRVHDGLA